ncbi:MAG: SDR family oxidoreductase [Acidobacteria bacterium]|nr:SDR family oxidoreductase [Acidobacteriota bacterium]MBI3656346.1 SDR family oxidoreductase [Acidobacteriota bacterium]
MHDTTYFNGKNVIITGGSSGIGKATAKRLAAAGANVFIIARGKERLIAAEAEIVRCAADPQQRFAWYALDVADGTAIEECIYEIAQRWGSPDMLINSAAIARPGYVEELPLEVFKDSMDIDYMGTVNAVKAVLPYLIAKKQGHVTNIGSMAGLIGVFGYTAYSGAKFAVTGFTQSLRAELLRYNVRVSLLCPPDTDTPQLHEENRYKPAETRAITGAAKMMSPDDVARCLLNGMAKKQFLILPNFESRMIVRLTRFCPWLVTAVMDAQVRRIQKQGGHNPPQS